MIQWFPGHMAKARREIEDNLKLVDIVFELIDARIPYSSKNPLINQILNQKPRLTLLTKASLADPHYTNLFIKDNPNCLEIDSITNLNIQKIVPYVKVVLKEKRERDKKRGMKPRAIRTMILGIPNVGKSTLINRLVGKKVARVGDKPGVTKARQWIRINKDLELLDMPGILWPKFEDKTVGIHLALTGAIKDEILSLEDLGDYLLTFLKDNYRANLEAVYKIDTSLDNFEIAKEIAKSRGIFGDDYLSRVMEVIINEFRSGKLGRITLDRYKNNG
ncbi:MAG TPA: ribosome biogenesis GTPase YlqF [Acholeplasmataceae bacterium]|nr:ribosome biogenesis GTPase YlqF [Acholeplasmataceae bacterium]